MLISKGSLLILSLLLIPAALTLAACGAVARPAPSARLSTALVVPTATPARAALRISGVSRVPSITVDLFTTTPVGDEFLIITATLHNTSQTVIRPALLTLTLTDADGDNFLRAQEAEFILRTAGPLLLPERSIPPGTELDLLLVFDVTAVQLPVQLTVHLPAQSLSAQSEVE